MEESLDLLLFPSRCSQKGVDARYKAEDIRLLGCIHTF